MDSRMGYEQLKIQSSSDGRGQDCVQYNSMGHTYLSCNLQGEAISVGGVADRIHRALMEESALQQSRTEQSELEELLRSFEQRVRKDVVQAGDEFVQDVGGSESVDDSNSGGNNDTSSSSSSQKEEEKEEEEEEELLEEEHLPTLDPMFVSWPELPVAAASGGGGDDGDDSSSSSSSSSRLLPAYLRPDWPTDEVCSSEGASQLRWDDYPTAFLSPENKGFE